MKKQTKYIMWATQSKDNPEMIAVFPTRTEAREAQWESERVIKVEVKVLE